MKLDFRRQFKSKLTIAIFLSLALHMIFGGGIVLTRSTAPLAKNKTEVELYTPEELQKILAAEQERQEKLGQIVESDENRVNDELDEKAKFLSRHNQKVIQETKAAKVGAFKNDSGQGGKPAAQEPPPEPVADSAQPEGSAKTQEKIATHENGDFEFGDELDKADPKKPKIGVQAFAPSFRKLPNVPDPTRPGDGQEASATDDHLKDVKTGMETMLSTREFMYYSYYNRIKDKLRQYWEPKIKEKFERIVRQGRTIASNGGDKITKVIIILDERGTLIRVQIVGASGVTDLDDAAVEAFRAAAPFPNPPKGIVEEDGTIKIRWDFVLEA